MSGVPGFILAGLALAGSPGPATLSLAAAGAAFGARHGLGYLGGIVCGMVVVMGVTATGIVAVLLALPGAMPVVLTLAAAYFVYLAIRIATAPPLADSAGQKNPPTFAAGLVLSLINPKGYAAMGALFSGFVLVRDRLVLDAAVKALVLVAVMVVVNVAWLFAGAALTRFFRDPALNRALNIAFAALLVGSVAVTLLF